MRSSGMSLRALARWRDGNTGARIFWDVSTDEKLVFLVEAVLLPEIDFFPGQIKRTSAFCDQSLDLGLSDNPGCGFQVHIVGKHHDLLNRSGKRLRNIGKILLALFQRPIEQIIVLEIQDVENDEEYWKIRVAVIL